MRRRLAPLSLAFVALASCDAIVGIHDVTLGTDSGASADGSSADVQASDAPKADAHDDATAPYPWPSDAVTLSPGCGSLARPGPRMVRIDDPTRPFCVDTTELTLAQWAVYRGAITALPTLPPVPDFCAGAVDNDTPPWSDAPSELPRAHVNWCHAKRYCAWAGKRLCGKRGGGKLETFDDRSSELNFVCGSGTGATFPYGSTYDKSKCNTETDRVVAVGTLAGCRGPTPPYDAVFDLVGNVAEWEDACEIGTSGTMECSFRGGSFASSLERLPCAENDQGAIDMDHPGLGIRCCADAE